MNCEDNTGSAGDGLPSTEPSVLPFVHHHVAGAESQPGGEGDVAACTLKSLPAASSGHRGKQQINGHMRSLCLRRMRKWIRSRQPKIISSEIWSKESCRRICVSLTCILW